MSKWRPADRRSKHPQSHRETVAGSTDWESLYRHFAPLGVRYAHALLRNHAEAEEAMHDAFCRLLASPKWHRSALTAGGFGAVFFTTIRRLSIDVMRKRQRKNGHCTLAAKGFDEVRPAAEPEGNEEVLNELIEQLPPSWKDVLHMRVSGGLTYAEIAQALDCTPAQVRTWLYRARRQLADELRRRGLFARPARATKAV